MNAMLKQQPSVLISYQVCWIHSPVQQLLFCPMDDQAVPAVLITAQALKEQSCRSSRVSWDDHTTPGQHVPIRPSKIEPIIGLKSLNVIR